MSRKTLITIGMIFGSIVGGFIAEQFGFGVFSFTALFISSAGAVAGILIVHRLTS